jgi:hypothetical protein
MPRRMEFDYNGESAIFTLTKITRSNLYGSKKRMPVDAQGRACSRALLTRDGRFVLPAGATAMAYLDELGDSVERSALQTLGNDGNPLPAGESSFETPVPLENPVEPAALLDCSVDHVYALEPITISPDLDRSLTEGAVFRFPFRFKSGPAEYAGFLLKNRVGFFLLLGHANGFDYVDIDSADAGPADVDEEEWDGELDFAMM